MRVLFFTLAICVCTGAQAEVQQPAADSPVAVAPPVTSPASQFGPSSSFGTTSTFGTTQNFGPSSNFGVSAPSSFSYDDNGNFQGFSSLPTGSSSAVIESGAPSSVPSGFSPVQGAPSTAP